MTFSYCNPTRRRSVDLGGGPIPVEVVAPFHCPARNVAVAPTAADARATAPWDTT
jgi:hypothetical protein